MFSKFGRKVCGSTLSKIRGDLSGYHGGKMPTRRPIDPKKLRFIDTDSVEQDPVPSFVRDMLSKEKSIPFSEKVSESIFTSVVKSMDRGRHRDGPPKRVSFHIDMLSLDNIRHFYQMKKKEYELYNQRVIPERQDQLGNEIGAAHFVVYRGGRVKFYGKNLWIAANEEKSIDYDANLPKKFLPNMYLEAIDLSGINIYYEGLDNLDNLVRLRWASFKNCQHIDDWCLDKICFKFRNSLEYLDISDCHKITFRGLTALCKMKLLKVLVVNNIASSNEFQLSCLMLEEIFPDLKIEGVSYIDLKNVSNKGEVKYDCENNVKSTDDVLIKS